MRSAARTALLPATSRTAPRHRLIHGVRQPVADQVRFKGVDTVHQLADEPVGLVQLGVVTDTELWRA